MGASEAQPVVIRSSHITVPSHTDTEHRETPLVTVIISGRNSEKWIAEAIESVLKQTIVCEVIVSDDCSTDRTIQIARQYNVLLITHPIHTGVVQTRNRGAAIARGKYLCFLDMDDMMSDTYIEDHLNSISDGCPFVYGSAYAFGVGDSVGNLWRPVEYEKWDKWSYNTVNTSSLYAKWAFEAAGRWQEVPTMWDFDLSLRASRFGTPRTSQAILWYRQHAGSWSQSVDLACQDRRREEYSEIIHRRNARLSIATIYSGRVSGLFPEWLDRIAATVKQAHLNFKPVLMVAVDPSTEPPKLDGIYGDTFAGVRIEVLPFEKLAYLDEKSRRDSVSMFLASANQYICDTLRPLADAVWFIEDDIFVPLTACQDMWRSLVQGQTCPAIVTGLYKNRHIQNQFVGGWNTNNGFVEMTSPPKTEQSLDVTGCGCMMTWLDRPMIPRDWPSHLSNIPAHDWALCQQVRNLGGRILINPDVKCGHAVTETEIIWP